MNADAKHLNLLQRLEDRAMTDDLIRGHLTPDLVGELRAIAWMRDDNEAKLMDCAADRLAEQAMRYDELNARHHDVCETAREQQQEIERLRAEIAASQNTIMKAIVSNEAARAAAIEECAKVAEQMAQHAPLSIAAAIRALYGNRE